MGNTVRFDEVVEAADSLSVEEQQALVDILNRRMIDHRRAELAKDIEHAEREFRDGGCRPVTPAELMGDILP